MTTADAILAYRRALVGVGASLCALIAKVSALIAVAIIPANAIVKPDPKDMGPPQRYPVPLMAGVPQRTDGNQIAIADCGFIATCKGLALRQPEVIGKLLQQHGDKFIFHAPSPTFMGAPETWLVDMTFAGSQSVPTRACWMQAMEKCAALTNYIGGYVNLGGIAAVQCAWVLGFETRAVQWPSPWSGLPLPSDDEMVGWIRETIARHETAIVGTGAVFIATPLVSNHQYYIIEVEFRDGKWWVLLGNPWGSFFDQWVPFDEFKRQFNVIMCAKYGAANV